MQANEFITFSNNTGLSYRINRAHVISVDVARVESPSAVGGYLGRVMVHAIEAHSWTLDYESVAQADAAVRQAFGEQS